LVTGAGNTFGDADGSNALIENTLGQIREIDIDVDIGGFVS